MKIISGGQTGADLGGLRAARRLGLKTGGWAPKGYLTEDGPRPYLLGKIYGLKETDTEAYPPRTAMNIREADLTLIFATHMDRGSALTRDMCFKMHKHVFHISDIDVLAQNQKGTLIELFHWIDCRPHSIINIAGNRESRSPGIGKSTEEFLVEVLGALTRKSIGL